MSNKHNFPVDIVYTWVNGSDNNWTSKKNHTLKKYNSIHKSNEVSGKERFKDNDELKFSLRSIYKFCPWVRKIFIVTDDQKPSWLNSNKSNLEIIDHKDIFDNDNHLPTFNSNAIEMRLHHINGLSNNFLSFNDDFFIGRSCKKEDFFHDSNTPKIFTSKKKSDNLIELINPNSSEINNPHRKAVFNSRKLIYDKYGIIINYDLIHSIKSLNKNVLLKIEKEFNNIFNQTLNNQFRDNTDTWIMSLYAFYSIANKINTPYYVPPYRKNFLRYKIPIIRRKRDYVFIPLYLSDKKIISKFNAVINYKPLTFCVNDSPGVKESARKISAKYLKEMFPSKSIYEK